MKDLLKNKTVLSFVGGIAATIAGAKFLKSKEDAKDICYEAKAKNEGE